ncbi:YihY/virulence factor BrkB family protein [Candidatus Dependentiae bacterium]|nr:YihY/virulence factor BrkB family protein [Candidatus Dependentiae bacterium]
MHSIFSIIKNRVHNFKEKIEDYSFSNPKDFFLTKLFFRIIKTFYITFTRFTKDNCVLHASALTYTSLLSLVPILALMFALLKGLSIKTDIKITLLKMITANQTVVVNSLMKYLDNVNAAKLGTFGATILILSAILVLTTIEKSFNVIWGVKTTRKTFRKFADYLSVLIVGPTMLVGAMSFTAVGKLPDFLKDFNLINTIYLHLITYAPYIMLWLAFSFFYIFIPNAKVKYMPGIIGGLVASILLQFAQIFYFDLNAYMSNLKIIYGGFAALPIFLIWLYISWLILLLGAELTFAIQNVANYRVSIENIKMSSYENINISIIIMYYVCKTFYISKLSNDIKDNTVSIRNLSLKLNLSERVINFVASNLYDAGFIGFDNTGENQNILLKINPEQITIKDIVNAVINNNKKSTLEAIFADVDPEILKHLEIFNNQDFILNRNFKELVAI